LNIYVSSERKTVQTKLVDPMIDHWSIEKGKVHFTIPNSFKNFLF